MQCHLLEHAFELILEAGEIPPLPFFTEMACQAVIRCDYEKAVNIFNVMAHAPFQVGFQEWVNFFERNRDRMDQAAVKELQDKLASHELRKELTLANLLRALEFICEGSVNSIASISTGTQNVSKASISTGMENVSKASQDIRYDDASSNLTLNIDLGRGGSANTLYEYQSSSSRIDTDRDSDEASATSNHYCEKGHARAHPSRVAKFFDHDLVSNGWASSADREWDGDVDDFDVEMLFPSSEVDYTEESDVPSAYEILESWKK